MLIILALTCVSYHQTRYMLANHITRKYPRQEILDRDTFAVSFNLCIILVPHKNDPDIKVNICKYLCARRQIAMPASFGSNYLTAGNTKRISRVNHIRLIHFGSKMPVGRFADMDSEFLEQSKAYERGRLPQNEYDISYNIYTPNLFSFTAKTNDRNISFEVFPTLTPFDERSSPKISRGGTMQIQSTRALYRKLKTTSHSTFCAQQT